MFLSLKKNGTMEVNKNLTLMVAICSIMNKKSLFKNFLLPI